MPCNFWEGVAHGALALVGLGSKYDPMGDLRAQYSQGIQQLESMTQQKSLLALQKENTNIIKLANALNTQELFIQKVINDNTSHIMNNIKTTNMFLAIVAIMVIVLILYLLTE
jgi:hypothetical protein